MSMLQAGMAFGPFQLVQPISQGGMGEVWKALKAGEGGWSKEVALKVMLPNIADEERFVAQFHREARVSAMLSHPNIVAVSGFGREGRMLWIEQELVHGEDLCQLLKRAPGGFPAPMALFIVGDILKGLEHALMKPGPDGRPLGIIHRDLKPSNVLCANEGHVKLADFGLAKVLAEGQQTIIGFKGTMGYIAPEQLRGAPATPSTDVFAVGLMLWELLTGRPLFDARSDAEKMSMLDKCYVPPLRLGADAPQGLDSVMQRLLGRSEAERYGNAGEALAALLALPVARPATSYDLKRFLAQLPPPVGAGPAPQSPLSPEDSAALSPFRNIRPTPFKPAPGPNDQSGPILLPPATGFSPPAAPIDKTMLATPALSASLVDSRRLAPAAAPPHLPASVPAPPPVLNVPVRMAEPRSQPSVIVSSQLAVPPPLVQPPAPISQPSSGPPPWMVGTVEAPGGPPASPPAGFAQPSPAGAPPPFVAPPPPFGAAPAPFGAAPAPFGAAPAPFGAAPAPFGAAPAPFGAAPAPFGFGAPSAPASMQPPFVAAMAPGAHGAPGQASPSQPASVPQAGAPFGAAPAPFTPPAPFAGPAPFGAPPGGGFAPGASPHSPLAALPPLGGPGGMPSSGPFGRAPFGGQPAARNPFTPPLPQPGLGHEMGLPPPAAAASKRPFVIGGIAAGVVLLVVIIIVLATGGKHDKPAPPPPAPAEAVPPPSGIDVPPPATPTTTSALQIVVDPGDAIVTVNGKSLEGSSPHVLNDVDSRWPLKIHAEKAGFAPFDQDVTVSGAKMSLPIKLIPTSVAAPPPPQPERRREHSPGTVDRKKKPKPGDLLPPPF